MIQKTRAHRALLPGFVRLTALVLTALTLCTFLTLRPAQAAEWMQPYLEQVQEWGVMRGDANGNLNEDRNITRAEFVTLVNRAFGFTDVGPNTFSDVRPNDWFAEDISIAHKAGYFNGTSPTTADPYALVTREQAAVLLGRCLRFQGVSGAANSTFTDMRDIGGWSRGLVQEAADLGIIQGYADGSFRPNLPITRGQMACFLVRALGTLVQEPGEQTSGGVYGNLTITTPGVKLKDTTVTGNLYLTGGVGLGNVELENVNVLGKIVICGGGEAEGGKQSVLLRNVTAGSLELDSLTGQFLSLQAEGLTNIQEVIVRTSGYVEDRTEDGLGLQTIKLDGIEGAQLQLAGNIKRVVDLTPKSSLQMAQGVADMITIDERALDATLTIDNKATVRELNLDRGTQVTGLGDIGHLNINAPGSKVEMLPDTIFVRPGITGNIDKVEMDNIAAAESSEDPRLLAGYPKARNIAPTSADAVFRTNKTGTIHWAITALMDGSLGEEELINPGSYAKILRSGTLKVTASDKDFTARLTGLAKEGSYYISALLEDARGRRSPVKIAAFSTPDDTAPNFANGYPQAPILTVDADDEQVAQIMVMATKDCQMYYVLLPKGSTAPTAADFRSAALPGNLGFGIVDLRKNTPFLVSRINTSHLQEQTTYDLYLWLNDADNGKSSAVRKVSLTTKDMTPPTILYLRTKTVAAKQVTMEFSLDEPGMLYWVVVKHGEPFYDSGLNANDLNAKIQVENGRGNNVVRSGGPIRAARGGTNYTFPVSGLDPQTTYDLYFVAKDLAGNYCTYAKALTPPIEIKTLDQEPPTATLEYSRVNESASGAVNPWSESDISIVFNERVLGAQGNNPGINFYDLYEKVLSSTGEEKTQAKETLGRTLQDYLDFFPGVPPTSGKPQQEHVTVKESQSDDDLEALPCWIDYREAIISQEGDKTTITFPGDNSQNRKQNITPAIKLESGATYFFQLLNIKDTSGNMIKPNPTYVPSRGFTTAYATVYIKDNENEETVTVGNDTRPARIFYMTPVGTESVSSGTRWDMLIWTDANIKYDLMVRRRGDTAWKSLGQASPNLTNVDASEVYNSVHGNFGSAMIASGLFGSVQEGQGRPYLNEFKDEVEFAIVPVDTTLNHPVHMKVQLYAGSNTALSNVSRPGQSTADRLKDQPITSIGDPDPFPVTFQESDLAPDVWVQDHGIIPGSTAAQVHLEVNRFGIVSYFAIPLDTSRMPGDHTGNDYIMYESAPFVGGKRVNLEDIPDGLDHTNVLKLDIGNPNSDDIITGNRRDEQTAIGNTGRTLLSSTGTMITITGDNGAPLKPNTTYLLYLATANPAGTQNPNVVCYQFTTTGVSTPKLELQANGSNATAQTDVDANVWGVLMLDGSQPYLLKPFTKAAGTATDDTYANATGSGNNGEYLVLDALLDDYGSGRGVKNSIFDIYATDEAKSEVLRIANTSRPVPNSIIDIIKPFPVDPNNPDGTDVRPFQDMSIGNLYCFLACAQSPLGSDPAFRALRPIQLAEENGPKIQGTSVYFEYDETTGRYTGGDVSLVFTKNLYFRDTSNIQTFLPVSSTNFESCVGKNFTSVEMVCRTGGIGGWQVVTEGDDSSTPRATNRLEFHTSRPAEGSFIFTINPGLCDQWGEPETSTYFQISLVVSKDPNGKLIGTLSGVPDEWQQK